MCFEIPAKQTPWTQTIVYKVMRLEFGMLASPVYYDKSKLYQLGDIQELAPHETYYIENIFNCRYTQHGIYVYKTLNGALKGHIHSMSSSFRIVECEVDPKDFLYHSDDFVESYRATYKKIKLLRLHPKE
jgi:hypothetical protein